MVVSSVPLPGVHRVYNCTVEGQHVYYVGELGALAHNVGCFTKGIYGIAGSGPVHHIATTYGKWGDKFRDLFASANRSINGIGNKVYLPGHYGPHSQAYHKEVFRRLTSALKGVRGKANRARALENELENIANDLLSGALKIN